MIFKPNVIKLSAWGNSVAVTKGQKKAGQRLSKSKVTCTSCFKRMTAQAFRYHRQIPECLNAKGEMQ